MKHIYLSEMQQDDALSWLEFINNFSLDEYNHNNDFFYIYIYILPCCPLPPSFLYIATYHFLFYDPLFSLPFP